MSVFSTVLGPTVVLWIGAAVFYVLDRFLKPKDQGLAEVVVLVMSLVVLLGAQSQLDGHAELSPVPGDLDSPGRAPFLVLGRPVWLLSLLVLGCALASSLASLGMSTNGRVGRLAATGAALLFLAAGDWATLAFAWLLVDLSLAYALNEGHVNARALGRTAMLSILGGVLFAVALLVGQRDGAGLPVMAGGTSVVLSRLGASLLAVGALLRVMPPPFPSWQAAAAVEDNGEEQAREADPRPSVRVLVSVVPMVLGTYLWARLMGWDVAQSAGWVRWLALWGGLVLVGTAIKVWSVQDPEDLVAGLHNYALALVLIGAGLGVPMSWLILLAGSLALGVSTAFVAWTHCQHLVLFDVRSYWRAAPMLLAILSLAGMPLTIGFPARAAMYRMAFMTGQWLVLLLLAAGEALFLGALLRLLLELERVPDQEALAAPTEQYVDDGRDEEPSSWWHKVVVRVHSIEWQREVGYAVAALLALAIVFLGLAPKTLSGLSLGDWFRVPTLPVWAALLLAAVGAVMLYRSRDRVLRIVGTWWPVAERLFPLEGVYRLIEDALRYVGALVSGGSLVVEGAGYMAWVVLVCLVILLFVVTR